MLPQSVSCDECGEKANVRGYGRIEYDWDDTDDPVATPQLRTIRLTVDCPHCGLRAQDYYPAGRPADTLGTPAKQLGRRLKAVSAALRS
jgi:hypothetical protein